MKYLILFIYLSFVNVGISQNQVFFNVLPDIGAQLQQSQFKSITADSNYLYIIGNFVSALDSLGNNEKIDIFASKFDYTGNLIDKSIIYDSTVVRIYSAINNPIYKLNDNLYYYNIYSVENLNSFYGICQFYLIDLKNLKVIKRHKVPLTNTNYLAISTYTQSEINNGNFTLIFNAFDGARSFPYIYNYDENFNLNKIIKIPTIDNQADTYRWVTKDEQGHYELIGERLVDFYSNFKGKGFLFYLKLDSAGNIIKQKRLDYLDNFFIRSGQTYTIIRNTDKSFAITLNKNLGDQNNSSSLPYVMGISPEFDSIYYLTNMSEYNYYRSDVDYRLTYMCRMNDNSGYVSCAAIDHRQNGLVDYGILFKTSTKGDSLWTRKYQPMGWDSVRASYMLFHQVICTPYNTIAVCARVSDSEEHVIKGWLLHLDRDGCLVPGCGQYVSTDDIKKGKEKAFKLFPNPVISDRLYILSQINADTDYELRLLDLNGHIIKQTIFTPQQGLQYLIEIPNEILPVEYIIQIKGKEYTLSENFIKQN